jgi:Ca2+-binding RTX toxin-like protein
VTASDGLLTAFQSVEITITNVNEGVTITSNPNFRVGENNTAVGMIAATDRDGDALVYSIAGGADAARFSIDGQTGAVSFVAGPDFEGAGDVDGDNSYELLIRASDGSLSDTQAVTVTVGDVNEAVRITSGASFVANENSDLAGTIGSSDPDGDAVSYSIVGGADASRLTIDERTGILAFVAAPNFEAPSDTGGDGVYEVLVRASDGPLSDTQAVTIRVQDVNEAPAITSGGGGDAATIWTNENASAVMTAIAIDPDSAISYSIAGGADAARFTIDAATGALRFVTAANFESPSDANRDNLYELVIQASDGSLSDTQTLLVSVQNVRDGLTLNGSTKADTLAGGSAEDTINGLAGNDSLYGYAGDDIINGGDGSDRIFGDLGADTLTGGAGADTFTFSALADSSASAMDRIVDFSRWQNDKISLSAIDANSLVAGDQAFAFIGSSGFTGKAGQLRSYVSNSTTYVAGDVNGDGIADFAINLGNVTVQASDFLL